MINFLKETLDMLKDCGKTEDDVLWVGRCEDWASDYPDVKNTWEWFKSKANFRVRQWIWWGRNSAFACSSRQGFLA